MTPPAITLVKLGGSLITDKRRGGARRAVIRRLAEELAAAARRRPGRLLVGHGSGSFGHRAAAEHGLAGGVTRRAQLPGVALTQARAASLHRLVIDALVAAGAAPFSLAPSSFMTATAGRPVRLQLEPLLAALDAGLLPVTYGDVVLDHRRGATICSTETVLLALADRLARRGRGVRRALWLGETDGVYDRHGAPVPVVTAGNLAPVLAAVEGAAGTDVTGGMRHRLETCLALARRGVESWILDGRQPGRLAAALAGRRESGSRVPARGGG